MINRFLLSLLFMLLSATNITAQVAIEDTFYKRMEGDTDSLLIQANIIRLEKQLSGNYELSSEAISTKTFEIDGSIHENNKAVINQLGNTEPIFEGVFVDDQFTGYWHGGTKGKAIELIESYPDGSLPLDIHYLRSESKLIANEEDSPTAEIELILIYPIKGDINETLLKTIDQSICDRFNITYANCMHPDSLLLLSENAFFKLYKEQNTDWHEKGNSFDWLKETSMSVNYNSNYILCLEYLEYVYTGGAHGMTKLSYDIFNLKTGDRIEYQDVFTNGSENELSDLLTSQIRSNKQIPDSVSLKEAGYFTDLIQPSSNVYINGSGIGFVYNPYEIAPYATGISNIFIKYDKLKGILKENTEVFFVAEVY